MYQAWSDAASMKVTKAPFGIGGISSEVRAFSSNGAPCVRISTCP